MRFEREENLEQSWWGNGLIFSPQNLTNPFQHELFALRFSEWRISLKVRRLKYIMLISLAYIVCLNYHYHVWKYMPEMFSPTIRTRCSSSYNYNIHHFVNLDECKYTFEVLVYINGELSNSSWRHQLQIINGNKQVNLDPSDNSRRGRASI